jgi:hypothetical protein
MKYCFYETNSNVSGSKTVPIENIILIGKEVAKILLLAIVLLIGIIKAKIVVFNLTYLEKCK